MKNILIFIGILVGFNVFSQTTYTWTGATDSDFFTSTNWNPSTGSPGGGDNAVFNSGSVACNINSGISIVSISLLSGYTGVVDMGSSYHTISGNITVNSGTLISTTNVLEIDVANSANAIFSLGGGVFTNNAGSIDVYSNSASNFAFAGNLVLATLNLYTLGGSLTLRTIDFGTNLTTDDLFFNSFATKIYDFQGTIHIKNSLDLGNAAHTTVSSTNNGTFIFDGSTASIIGSSNTGAGKAYLPNMQINTTGAYTITRSLNVLGSWTGTQGTLTAGTSTVNMYGTSATISGAVPAFDNLTIQTGASVTLPASEVLIGGALTRTGTLTFQSGTILGLNGTGAQSISGSAITLGGIHAYSGSRTITMSTGITILDVLQVDANVTFASGGNVTLAASSGQTARLAELGAGASVTGNVTVETFLPGPFTGWANLGVRGVNGQTVANWDTYVSSGGANGIPMTCTLCSFNPTVLSTPFTSIQGWDEPNDGYVELIGTSPMNPGVGRWVYVGDGQTTTSDLKLINTGSLAQGPISVPVTASGAGDGFGAFYNLVANPYACPISATALINFGNNPIEFFQASIYVWRADLNGGAGAYTTFNGITGDGQGQTDVIPGGQGFYVAYEPLFGTGFMEFGESVKIATNAPVLKSTSNDVEIVKLTLKGLTDENTTVFVVHPEATPFFDRKFDAHKLFTTPGYVGYPGPYSNYTTLSSKDAFGVDYAIQCLPPLTSSVSIPVLAKVSTSGTYTIGVTERVDFNNCLVLIDRLDNSYHDLGVSDYVFTISDTTSTPRFDLVLCKDESYTPLGIVSENLSSKSILISQDQQGAYVKTVFPQSTKATISVYNLVGQKLIDDIEVTGTATDTRLNLDLHNQVVFIRVLTDKETSTKKMVLR